MKYKKHAFSTKSFGLGISAGWRPRAVLMPIADVLAGKNCLSDQHFSLRRDLRSSPLIAEKDAVKNKKHICAATRTARKC